jgi:predicted ATP-binding protein involved in virulence
MAKKKINKKEINHSYFFSLELRGINCFKDNQILDLFDGNGNYSPWTIILGDNGTGKTTLLRIIDRMQLQENIIRKNEYDDQILFEPLLVKLRTRFKDNLFIQLTIKNNQKKETISVNFNDGIISYTGLKEANVFLISYGASRRMSKNPNLSSLLKDDLKHTTLFDESLELINVEEWYLQKYLSVTTSKNEVQKQLQKQLDLIKSLLIDFLPDVHDLGLKEIKNLNEKTALEVKINENEWIYLRELSFGYQTITALLVDIASKMMEQYPQSENPLSEPVIILIDEIDLHLHPKWQRTVIDKFSHHFPKAQYIVTAHSPLIVQAAEDRNANIVVCRKEGDRVIIDNDPDEVKGWRVDQILTSDLFEVESSQSIEIEKLRNEKISLLLNKSLSNEDKERLKSIDQKLFNSPVFSSKESINAEALIKKAAELLKK